MLIQILSISYFLAFSSAYQLGLVNCSPELSALIYSSLSSVDPYIEVQAISESVLLNSSQNSFDFLVVANVLTLTKSLVTDYANTNQVPILFLDSGLSEGWAIYIDSSINCKVSAISAVLNYFQINTVGVAWVFTQRNQQIIKTLDQYLTGNSFTLSIEKNIGESEIQTLFGKTFKVQGIQNFIFIGDESACETAANGFKSAYMEKEGNIAVYLDECIYQAASPGSLILVNPSAINSNSYETYLLSLLNPFFLPLSTQGLSNFQLLSAFLSVNTCTYSLANINNTVRTVGSVTATNLRITDSIVYFGGSTNRTILAKPRITISATTSNIDPPGNPTVYSNGEYQQGTYFGVKKVKKDQIYLKNYEFNLYDKVDCGVSVFDYNFSSACFESCFRYMGYAYIPPIYSIVPDLLSLLSDLSFNIPSIGGGNSLVALSNTAAFPYFTRMSMPGSYSTQALVKLLSIYGWNKIIVFHASDGFGVGSYNVILNLTASEGIQIINDESERSVTINDVSEVPNYYSAMQKAINLGCNIWVLILGDPEEYLWLEGLHDLGVRNGDFTYILFSYVGKDAVNEPGGNATKRAELLNNAITIGAAGWLGDYGQEVLSEFKTEYSDSWSRCGYIDAVTTAANTIDFLLNQGRNYENITEFNRAQRNTRILGCSGEISFDRNSNNRNLYFFNLYSLYVDEYGKY
jgi:hypothetical protein